MVVREGNSAERHKEVVRLSKSGFIRWRSDIDRPDFDSGIQQTGSVDYSSHLAVVFPLHAPIMAASTDAKPPVTPQPSVSPTQTHLLPLSNVVCPYLRTPRVATSTPPPSTRSTSSTPSSRNTPAKPRTPVNHSWRRKHTSNNPRSHAKHLPRPF